MSSFDINNGKWKKYTNYDLEAAKKLIGTKYRYRASDWLLDSIHSHFFLVVREDGLFEMHKIVDVLQEIKETNKMDEANATGLLNKLIEDKDAVPFSINTGRGDFSYILGEIIVPEGYSGTLAMYGRNNQALIDHRPVNFFGYRDGISVEWNGASPKRMEKAPKKKSGLRIFDGHGDLVDLDKVEWIPRAEILDHAMKKCENILDELNMTDDVYFTVHDSKTGYCTFWSSKSSGKAYKFSTPYKDEDKPYTIIVDAESITDMNTETKSGKAGRGRDSFTLPKKAELIPWSEAKKKIIEISRPVIKAGLIDLTLQDKTNKFFGVSEMVEL